MEAVCAIAAKLSPAEVPMIVPNMMGPDVARCRLGVLFFDLVSQVASR